MTNSWLCFFSLSLFVLTPSLLCLPCSSTYLLFWAPSPSHPLFLFIPPTLGDITGSGSTAHRRLRRQQQADWSAHPASGRPAGWLPSHLAEERGQQALVVAHHLLPNHPQDLRARRLWRWEEHTHIQALCKFFHALHELQVCFIVTHFVLLLSLYTADNKVVSVACGEEREKKELSPAHLLSALGWFEHSE